VADLLVAESPALAPGVRLRSAWASARARNALRRPGVIGGVGGAVLAASLAALVLVPREAMRAARSAAPRPGEKVDTAALAARGAEERVAFLRSEAAVAAKRQQAARAVAVAAARARAAAAAARGGVEVRDSLRGVIGELDALIARAQTSPLPGSFRALAGARGLRGDPRVRAAIDSLDEVEREREAFGVVGGVDPVYVSLTNRVTQLGRVVEGVAERRRAALQEAVDATTRAAATGAGAVGDSVGNRATSATSGVGAASTGATPPGVAAGGAPIPGVGGVVAGGPVGEVVGGTPGGPPQTQGGAAALAAPNQNVAGRADSAATGRSAAPSVRAGSPFAAQAVVRVDTVADVARRDTARARLQQVEAALAVARMRNQAVDRRVAAARERADVDTPPLAVVLATTVLAAALGFAAALAGELRRPRLADADEAERVTRVRVLAVVRPTDEVNHGRARRSADLDVPTLVDASVESYRLLYLSLSATGAAVSRVAVTAAEPSVATAVALNVAAAAADDGRSTLVVDADVRYAMTSAALGVRDRLGLADALGGGFPMDELVIPVRVGRGVTVDVIPAGGGRQRSAGGQRRGPGTVAARAAVTGGEGAGRPHAEPRVELARVARGYDMTVASLPPVPPGGAGEVDPDAVARDVLAREVIVCARAGHTPLAGLTREIARLNALGARVRGLVVWDDELPPAPASAAV
jgi:Mrp family chromosome partitioning ATPase